MSLTDRGPHPVALWIYQASDLCEVAVALADVLDAGGLHQEGVVRGEDPLDPLPVVFHQGSVFPAAHERPHLLIGGDLGFLLNQNQDLWEFRPEQMMLMFPNVPESWCMAGDEMCKSAKFK